MMALAPLMAGGDPATIWKAARRIRRILPGESMSDPEAILWLLAEGRYNKEQLAKVTGRRRMQALVDLLKESPLWREAEAKGRAEGNLEAQRAICLRLVARHHPALLDRARPRIEACGDPAVLEAWIFAASESDAQFLARLLAGDNGD